jgi:Cys-rich four helix bundle protein (predicted Tat secretion target)
MKRRELIVAAATLAAATYTPPADAQAKGEMHPPKYKALEESTSRCVSTGEDCLRHCLAMMSMKDTSMAACANSIVELVAACRALQTLAAVNSTFTPAFAKDVAAVCSNCEKECRKFYEKYSVCKACADACHTCADDCRKATA